MQVGGAGGGRGEGEHAWGAEDHPVRVSESFWPQTVALPESEFPCGEGHACDANPWREAHPSPQG